MERIYKKERNAYSNIFGQMVYESKDPTLPKVTRNGGRMKTARITKFARTPRAPANSCPKTEQMTNSPNFYAKFLSKI